VGILVLQDKKLIERNLQENARGCQWLVLWLDCDREGENIAFEVDSLSVSSEMPARLVKRNPFLIRHHLVRSAGRRVILPLQ